MIGSLAKYWGVGPVFVIGDVERDEFHEIAEIHRESFAKGWSDGELHQLLSNKNYFCLTAKKKASKNRSPLGFILVRTVADEAEIITIATRKSARRNGLASRLLEAAILRLQADRMKNLFLEVDENNDGAVELYKKHSFEKIGERKGYYTSGKGEDEKASTALVMQRELS